MLKVDYLKDNDSVLFKFWDSWFLTEKKTNEELIENQTKGGHTYYKCQGLKCSSFEKFNQIKSFHLYLVIPDRKIEQVVIKLEKSNFSPGFLNPLVLTEEIDQKIDLFVVQKPGNPDNLNTFISQNLQEQGRIDKAILPSIQQRNGTKNMLEQLNGKLSDLVKQDRINFNHDQSHLLLLETKISDKPKILGFLNTTMPSLKWVNTNYLDFYSEPQAYAHRDSTDYIMVLSILYQLRARYKTAIQQVLNHNNSKTFSKINAIRLAVTTGGYDLFKKPIGWPDSRFKAYDCLYENIAQGIRDGLSERNDNYYLKYLLINNDQLLKDKLDSQPEHTLEITVDQFWNSLKNNIDYFFNTRKTTEINNDSNIGNLIPSNYLKPLKSFKDEYQKMPNWVLNFKNYSSAKSINYTKFGGVNNLDHFIYDSAMNTRPVIHQKTAEIIVGFYHLVKDKPDYSGIPPYNKKLSNEYEIVREMVTRFLRVRPTFFLNPQDTSEFGTAIFNYIPSDKQMSYPEIAVSALINISSPVLFVGKCTRGNGTDNTFTQQPIAGFLIGGVGARMEKMQFNEGFAMERLYLADFTDKFKDDEVYQIWNKFYKDDTSIQVEGNFMNKLALSDRSYPYSWLYKRMALTYVPIVLEANKIGQDHGNKVYLILKFFGTGAWSLKLTNSNKFADNTKKIIIDIVNKLVEAGKTKHIAIIEYNYPDLSDIDNLVKGNEDTEFVSSNGDPLRDEVVNKITLNELIPVLTYAWDGNSFPGNEYWKGYRLGRGSDDPAFIACSTAAYIQNPIVNTSISGRNVQVYSWETKFGS